MVDVLTGEMGRRQQRNADRSLQLQKEQIARSQRQSLAQLVAEQGELDQEAVGAGSGRRRRGSRLLTFITDTAGQATLG